MIYGHLLLHEFDELVLGLDGALVLLLLYQKRQVLVDDVRIPSVVVVLENLLKERLIDVKSKILSFLIAVLL